MCYFDYFSHPLPAFGQLGTVWLSILRFLLFFCFCIYKTEKIFCLAASQKDTSAELETLRHVNWLVASAVVFNKDLIGSKLVYLVLSCRERKQFAKSEGLVCPGLGKLVCCSFHTAGVVPASVQHWFLLCICTEKSWRSSSQI